MQVGKAANLKDAIARALKVKWESAAIRKNATRFSWPAFKKEITSFVTKHGQN